MKRFFDVLVAFVGLIMVLPIMLIVAILIVFCLGFPIFFTQIRPGYDAKPFKLIKFRSMKDAYDANGNLLEDDKRLTKLGRFLRTTSLDELPEFFNVLKGDMSLVGPRPLLMEYLPLYTREQNRRHQVRPGITGWAQVNGRNNISWDEKFKMDVWYIENKSIWLDFKILCKTFFKVCQQDGISAHDYVTAKRFTGDVKK